MEPIPQEWIKSVVDQYLKLAERLGTNTVMGQAMLLRADHAMDLVKAFRERNEQKQL